MNVETQLAITKPILSLDVFYSPQQFDTLKNDLDQRAFYALFENHSIDPVMHCRKAELLIQLESDDEALELLEGNPSLLASGLKAKIFVAQNRLEEAEALCDVIYQGINPIELEGFMHLVNMSMHCFYLRQDYQAAMVKSKQAEGIAKLLGLAGRLKTLAAEREVIEGKLDIAPTQTLGESGNAVISQFQLITRWRSLMVAGKFDEAMSLSLEPAMSKLSCASKYYQEGSMYRAASIILDTLPSLEEFKLYHALMTLQLYVKLQNPLYANPKTALELLKGLRIIPQMLEEARLIYPLGICLAASQLPNFEGAGKVIPKLKHTEFRDGVWAENTKLAVLPNDVRKAWIDDSLNPGENSLQSVRRQYRHRASIALAKAGLEYRHIVTQAEVTRDVSRLSEFLVR